LVVLALAVASARASAADARLVTYTSPVDRTEQAYGIYVPAAAAGPAGYPAILHGHGYGWSVSADFDAWQRRWADDHGWALLNVNARGPTFYEGIGQTAVLEVVEDACRRFNLDRRRLFFTGASMGGTGAFRQGVRYPDVFAAAAAVDGWADWRIWHWKWYAREDLRDDIEEFRRPLLSACAPFFWAERAAWGRVRAIIDGQDTVVEPDEGLHVAQRLADLRREAPEAYKSDEVLNQSLGHGGGYDLASIYDFFLRCAPGGQGKRVSLTAWRLADAAQGWLRLDGIERPGQPAQADSTVDGARISVWTDNVSALTVYAGDRSCGEAPGPWQVWVDGQLAYEGPPAAVAATAAPCADGSPWWSAADVPAVPLAPTKRRGLEGPIGDAFLSPFVVAYACHGEPSQAARHREEAEAFARGWNDFFVHGPGIVAQSEDAITEEDLARANLVLFGCLDCSRLLRLAERSAALPVAISHNAVRVRPAWAAEREYLGPQFGAFLVCPNPLSGFRRYLVVCSGRWYTQPNAATPQGLDYDLEKLPWAYPDYFVFNNDQGQLPFVLNVNNKPPVTYYEAASFCEAGYFDERWRLGDDPVAAWVKALAPPRARLIHVASVTRSAAALALKVADAAGAPVAKARVTICDGAHSLSAVADDAGAVTFGGLADGRRARLVSVMATACAYDRDADGPGASALAAQLAGLADAAYTGPRQVAADGPPASLTFALTNTSAARLTVEAALPVSAGALVSDAVRDASLAPGETLPATWDWRPLSQGADLALATLTLRVPGPGGSATGRLTVPLRIAPARPDAVEIAEVTTQQVPGGGWLVGAVAENHTAEALDVTFRGMVVQANWPLEPQKVRLDARGSHKLTWSLPASVGDRWVGPAQVVVYAPEFAGVLARAEAVLGL
jgi:hypothetical protein